MVTALMNSDEESFTCPIRTPSTLTACSGPSTSKRPTRTTSYVKNPALVLAAPAGGAVGTNPSLGREEPVPMSVSVAGGIARPHLYEVGKKTGPGIDVHEIDVQQLTASLNAIRTQTLPEAGEVTAFTTMLSAMFEQGRLAGLAEAGVA